MTELRELMHQAIDHHSADMTGLAARARLRGTTLHRRERLTTPAVSLALLAVFVVGPAGERALLDRRPATDVAAAIGTNSTAPTAATLLESLRSGARWRYRHDGPRSHQTPLTRAIGQSLAHAVTSVGGGTTSAVQTHQYDATPTIPANIEAMVQLRSPGGTPWGRVSVTFWPEASYGGTGSAAKTRAWLQECGGLPDCRTSTLPDGSLVRVSSAHQQLSDGTWEVNSVERDVDGVVEVVAAYAPRAADGRVTAPHASLTAAQLVSVASGLAPLR
jgi:hypothetical protein